jgi:DNA repair protein RadC
MSDEFGIKIKQLSEEDRPREKLMLNGKASLSNAELIAILIGSGSKNESAVQLAQRILSSFDNNLNQIGKLTINDLMKFNGIGEAKAISIIAALELGKRRKEEEPSKRQKITSSKDAFEIMHPLLQDLPHEEFWILLLNRSNSVIEKIKISVGGISGTVADIRLISKPAIEKLASGIILSHNHPSGNKKPSMTDENLTKKIKQALDLFEIKLLDHIIVTEADYFSFADEGLL